MKIFIARLAGTPVFDPVGDQIGRVRDVVVAFAGAAPPRVHGLVVEVQPRRRVFLPITRVRGIEAGSVVFSGQINVRRFEQRATESLVIGQMLDLEAQVEGERMTVLDLAMEQTRRAEWLITKVAVVRVGQGLGLRRRGPARIVDWSEVSGFSAV
ncbi:PRC-barrel domain-containing protein, partial [Streptosporangium algeriense]